MTNQISSDFQALRDTIQNAIDEGRIGTPQFFRCIATMPAEVGFRSVLDELKSLANGFFGGSSSLSHEMGSEGVYNTEMLKWPQGQSAIITVSRAMSGKFPNLDLMLIGSRGTLYHNDSLGVLS